MGKHWHILTPFLLTQIYHMQYLTICIPVFHPLSLPAKDNSKMEMVFNMTTMRASILSPALLTSAELRLHIKQVTMMPQVKKK